MAAAGPRLVPLALGTVGIERHLVLEKLRQLRLKSILSNTSRGTQKAFSNFGDGADAAVHEPTNAVACYA